MLLQKAFFRKKKIGIYIFIFVILFSIIFLLNSYKKYYETLSNNFMVNHTILIANTGKNHKKLVEEEKEIKSFQRTLIFEKGIDNDIITTTTYKQNKEYIDEPYNSILDWKNLMYNNQILVFPASFFDKKIDDNQIILFTQDFDYKPEDLLYFYNKSLTFSFNDENISLEIKEILEPILIPCVCISDNLYNNLLLKEENYIYYIKLAKYSSLDKIQEKWKNLSEKEIISYKSETFYKDDELGMNQRLEDLINMLSIVGIISLIIFYIIMIIVIKDLVSDEQKDILLLKNIGYNKFQNIFNTLKNFLIFDIIVFCISLLLYIILIFILNNTIKFNLEVFNYGFIYLFISVLLAELFFCIIYIKNY